MLTSALETQLNQHLNLEFASAHLYLSMSAYFDSEDLPGFANWMFVQYQEEVAHAMKFFRYLNDRGGRVRLCEVPRPQPEWDSAQDAARATLTHERRISGAINGLVAAALEERDYATHNFLQWFVSEQVEEEASAAEIVAKLAMLGESRQGLYLLDRELAGRRADAEA